MISADIWTKILEYLDIQDPYRCVCISSMKGYFQLVSYYRNEIQQELSLLKHNSTEHKDKHIIYMENLARSHQWNKLIVLYRENIDKYLLIPCHLALIEGYPSIANNIRLYFNYIKPKYMADELELIDTYFNPDDDKLVANLLLNSSIESYVHLITPDLFDSTIIPLLKDYNLFAEFMYPYIDSDMGPEEPGDLNCGLYNLFCELNDMFKLPNDQYHLWRCPYMMDSNSDTEYKPSYV